MKENKFLYAVRLFACLAVITIHTRFPGYFGQVMDSLARFAVPYFFAVSGRFLLTSSDESVSYIRSKTCKSLNKLLKITGLVYFVHLLFSFVVHVSSHVPVSKWFSSKFNISELIVFLLYNSGKFIYDGSYTFDHMWYLFALIYVYVLIIIFARLLRKWYKALIGILLFFLFFGEALQTYYPIRPFGINICTWYIMRNWLFVGMPFVLIGILFSDYIRKRIDTLSEEKKNLWCKKTRLPAICGLIIGGISTVIETNIYGKKEVFIGSLVMVVSILFLSECRMPTDKYLWKIGKEASSNIYYFHVLIIAVIDIMAQNGIIGAPSMWFKPLLVMAICVILFYFIPAIIKKRIKTPSST